MKLRLISLTGSLLNKDVYETIIPTEDGEISVFPSHEDLVTLVGNGVLTVRHQKDDPDNLLDYYAVSGGIAVIADDEIKILVDEADYGEDLIESEVKDALNRAIEMRNNSKDQVEREKAHQLVDRQIVRLKVAELRRHKRK
jgi:F-type H+-transporting ATPase subunit epsilon